MFRGYGELDEADLNKCYSLEDLEHSMKGYSLKPKEDTSRYEKMATWALDAFFTRKKTCWCWQGSARPRSSAPLQNSSHKRADKTVYDGISKTQVLLQIEVQSSPMRETVIKSIHGAADMLRLLRNNDVNFNKFYRFCISEVWWKKKCYEGNSHLEESAFQLSFKGFDHSFSNLDREACCWKPTSKGFKSTQPWQCQQWVYKSGHSNFLKNRARDSRHCN